MSSNILNKRGLAAITARNGQRILDDPDFAALHRFAHHVLVHLGLDVKKPGAVFDWDDPENGCEDVKSLMSLLTIGDELDVHLGFYTGNVRYRVVPTVGGELCSKCDGKGCEDWAGEDCPSDETEPIRVDELEA